MRKHTFFFSPCIFQSDWLKAVICIITLILFLSKRTICKPLNSGWLIAFITQSGYNDLHNHCALMVIRLIRRDSNDNFVLNVVDRRDPRLDSLPCHRLLTRFG